MKRLAAALTIISALVCPAPAAEPARAGGLLEDIARIGVIDHHSHAEAVSAARTEKWDLFRPQGTPPYAPVVRLRLNNPEWLRVWHALYGYPHADMNVDHTRGLLETKLRIMREQGGDFPAWVLDRAGIDVAFVNADTLGPGLEGPRFRWVPFADALLYPFDKKRATLDRLMRESKASALPATLGEYVGSVVVPTLERWKSARTPAIKFLAAYRRPIDFSPVPEGQAAAAYARYARGEEPGGDDYKALQDYLFRRIARECGRVGLVVQVHTGNGNGPYFNNSGANPALLEPALDDRALRQTTFVLVHGGWPFEKLAGAMLDKPTVYADFSAQAFYLSTHALSEVLRGWLEWQPEKVLFGTDAYSDANTPLSDWEEKAWLTTMIAREALARALEGMMRDGQITRDRALEIARLVLRENAIRIYGLSVAAGSSPGSRELPSHN
ncbi:MAG: amidohydrolase family protein [Opitutaceae bacterium]|nr:amidohydrolase family protein [Opitutaceae bacterium]